MPNRKSSLWWRCQQFVENQSAGEWGEEAVAEDTDLLTEFVKSECAELVTILKACLYNYTHSNFTNRHEMANRIRKALANVVELPIEERQFSANTEPSETPSAEEISLPKDVALPWSLNQHCFPDAKEISILLNFANAHRDGAHGCQMDFETAQALSKAVLSMLATISHLKVTHDEDPAMEGNCGSQRPAL